MNIEERQADLSWFGQEENPYKRVEIFSFAEDVAYGNNFGRRVHSAIKRCLAPILSQDGEQVKEGMLPKFDPQVKVRVTMEVLLPGDPLQPSGLDSAAAAITERLALRDAEADHAREMRAMQTTIDNLRLELSTAILPDPSKAAPAVTVSPKFTKRFLTNECNKEALTAICTEMGIPVEETNAKMVDAILKAQG